MGLNHNGYWRIPVTEVEGTPDSLECIVPNAGDPRHPADMMGMDGLWLFFYFPSGKLTVCYCKWP